MSAFPYINGDVLLTQSVYLVFEDMPSNLESIIVSGQSLSSEHISYFLFQLASPFLRLGKIAKNDGLTAIRRAYTFSELDDLAQKINPESYTHYRSFFFRQLLVLRKDLIE